MDTTSILEEVIQRAIEGGWKENGILWMHHVANDYTEDYDYSGLIFNHGFSKALFGKGPSNMITIKSDSGVGISTHHPVPLWQYHIQQLAIATDRVDYLRKWLENKS